jgi:hypothetical protein
LLFEEFRKKYILSDGQVLSMTVEFEQKKIGLRLNAQKFVGKKTERCEIVLHLYDVFELDLVETLDFEWHSDVVFVQLEGGEDYVSFDPYGNSGLPHESDNFIVKCKGVEVFDGGESDRLE